ncbi:MAG: response regulator transcription factor [Bacteroidetes bacterium]|nr:response regulator transcription factor [Bacteroidota bacterium]
MEIKKRVLLAEDDENLGSLLREYLQVKGFEAELFCDGEKGYKAFMKNRYDICILDIMMPNKDGLTLAREIRAINNEIPVIFLTAKSMKDDVLEGFRSGGDDYITKPFSMEELLFRIEAILRRSSKGQPDTEQNMFRLGNYIFDSNKRLLTRNAKATKLTTKESDLLKLLCINKNKMLERNLALKAIWTDDSYFNARSMDVYITKLRKHLKEEPSVEIINVHGQGFKLLVPEDTDTK